jgi:chemosensory pili system protein ChpA (sensor histidine kinase/response regulator)
MNEVSTQTLHVVARELNSELNDARVALELFGEQQDQVELLVKCRDHLRQVRGALRMVEVFGAALLVEEMEQLAQYLIDHIEEQRHLTEGLDALMRAMVQLPTYLDRVMSGGRDMALILLPLLNDLRAVRGNPLLSEGTLLLLNLSSDQQANPVASAPGEPALPVANWARRMRTRFQLGLLGWIKGERIEQNLEILSRAAEKLEQVATTQPVFQLWWVVGAVIEALREGGLEGTASIKRLLGQADRQLRRLYEVGEQAYTAAPPLDLLNNLLYYVARASSNGLRVTAVRASFRLHDLLPLDAQVQQARESLSAPSVKLMHTVANAIREDLAHVKDAFDIFVRKPGSQPAELAPQLELLKKIGDTLGVLGLGELREQVQGRTTHLQAQLQRGKALDEASLLAMAGTLINVESNLDDQLLGLIAPSGEAAGEGDQEDAAAPAEKDVEYRQVSEAVLRECIVNLARIKEAIALALEKPGESQSLDQIPALMRGIIAGMLMLGKSRAVEVTERISRALAQHLRSGSAPQPSERMDRLADAMVAMEYYMETLQAGRSDPWYMLDNAETCLRALDAMSTGTTGRVPSLAPSEAVYAPAEKTLVITQQHDRLGHIDHERTLVLNESSAGAATLSQDDHTATQFNLPPVLMRPPDKEDPQFVELFIEEARDEVAKLQSMLPRWEADPQDQDALINVRRSFHTLKGSGRLVGAQLIGEFAWSMENLLNRIISKTLERTPQAVSVLKEAVVVLPELVEQLESGRLPQTNVGVLIGQAHALADARDIHHAAARTGTQPALKSIDEATTKTGDTIMTETVAAATTVASPTGAQAGMDNTLNEIFAKEVAGHLAQIREYLDKCRTAVVPCPVTEALHRACHTLNGASKTAGARHNIRITEPLNHYIRKLYDNGMPLPAEGLRTLRDAVGAIENIVRHPSESTMFFSSNATIPLRLQELEHRLDADLAERNARPLDATGLQTAIRSEPVEFDNLDDPNVLEMSLSMSMPITSSTATLVVDDVAGLTRQPDASKAEAKKTKTSRTEEDQADEWFEITTDDLRQMMGDAASPTVRIAALSEDALEQSQSIHVDDVTNITPTLDESAPAKNSAEKLEREPITIIETAPWAANFAAPVLDDVLAIDVPADRYSPAATPNPMTVAATEQATVEVPHLAAWSAPSVASAFTDESLSDELLNGGSSPLDRSAVHTDESINEVDSEIASTSAADVSGEEILGVDAVMVDEADAALDDEYDPDVAAIFTEEATELLEVADSALQGWQGDRNNPQHAYELKRALHTLKGGARMAGIRAMGDLSHELETFMERVEQGVVRGTPEVFQLLQACLDELNRMRDVVSQGRGLRAARNLIGRIHAILHGEVPVATAAAQPVSQVAAPTATVADISEPPLNEVHVEVDMTPEAASLAAAPFEDSVRIELDEAALTQLAPIGEDAFAEFVSDDLQQAEPGFKPESQSSVVAGMHMDAPVVERTMDFELSDTHQVPELVLPVAEAANETDAPEPKWVEANDDDMEAPAALSAPEPITETAEAPVALPPGRTQAAPERSEVARVDADLLDSLLNNAGEVSILRSRLEQQVSSLEFNLTELGRTVTRLKDQFRKLEIETEAQILHKHQDDSRGREDFDPLELDRYSSIQQLSRALAESVSDVDSIEGLLENMTREAQSLLLQQSRVVTEMQNGLMRTRMVPFSRHAQRLTRLVRQVAAEVGKQVELTITGATGELDRQVLERMLPPFEHMLRNSVVHGIEIPEQRTKAGKPATGSIRVGLHREGAEMVIVLQDDGRGIDVNAVREKARAKGLVSSDRLLTDEEALQLILEPGFSTATAVTQHAGRGVGMDVVVNEIKKLGGALFTESKAGEGVKFTIRLPFTLAVGQALLVRVGDSELYALPLATVESVVRLPHAEVESYLNSDHASFNYGGQSYKVQHLGTFIDAPPSVLPEGEVSLVLIKAGEHSTALVTDELLGNREIVVKNVGPQISSIRGIAGATILGDGKVVMILDMGALVRSEWRGRATEAATRGEDRRTLVLVVDDSITVRRVTQRLLERHGMRVLTAKDGLDALEILQEHVPDVILLDIEMPRMDGYEMATQVRGNQRLADVPIIMITSRVSDKHRARAIEIGVNDYLGKPYQENQLLDAIEVQLQAHRRKAVH